MPIENKKLSDNKELGNELEDVSGGTISKVRRRKKGVSGWLGGKDTLYRVSESSGKKRSIGTYSSLEDASDFDRKLNQREL